MKKAVRLLTVLASSLLLAGCGIPDNLKGLVSLEEFLHWREKFFVDVTVADIASQLLPILSVYFATAGMTSLGGIFYNYWHKKPILSGKLITGWTLLIAAGAMLIYIPTATLFGRAILPDDLTIDKVMVAMHWTDLSNLEDIVTATWGFAITVLIPLGTSLWQYGMLLWAVIAIGWSIAGQSLKGVAYALTQILGWGLWLVVFNAWVTWIGGWYPDWNIPFVDAFISLFYTGFVISSWVNCNIVAPILAAVFFPHDIPVPAFAEAREAEDSGQGELAEKPRRRGRGAILPFPIPGPRGSPSGGVKPSAPSEGRPQDGRGRVPEGAAPAGESRGDVAPQPTLARLGSLVSAAAAIESSKSGSGGPEKPSPSDKGGKGLPGILGRAGSQTPSKGPQSGSQPPASAGEKSPEKDQRLPKVIQPVAGSSSGVLGDPREDPNESGQADTVYPGLPPVGKPGVDDVTRTPPDTAKKLLPEIRPSSARPDVPRMEWLDEAVQKIERGKTLPSLDALRSAPQAPVPPDLSDPTVPAKRKQADLPPLKPTERLPLLKQGGK